MSKLNSGDLAMIVRNTLEGECTQRVIGTPVQVVMVVTPDLLGFGPVWQTRQLRCPGCGDPLDLFLEADLQRLRPPEEGSETETPADVIREMERVR